MPPEKSHHKLQNNLQTEISVTRKKNKQERKDDKFTKEVNCGS